MWALLSNSGTQIGKEVESLRAETLGGFDGTVFQKLSEDICFGACCGFYLLRCARFRSAFCFVVRVCMFCVPLCSVVAIFVAVVVRRRFCSALFCSPLFCSRFAVAERGAPNNKKMNIWQCQV